MGADTFQFKEFSLGLKDVAMKLTTDSTLLGAWVQISNSKTILDIGTGSGIIALMMAQRSEAQVFGIELDPTSAIRATENAEDSKWANRIKIQNADFLTFDFKEQLFDLIVCNPPFFSNGNQSEKKEKAQARHNAYLPFVQLISISMRLLAERGVFSLILPKDEFDVFEELANNQGLFCVRKMNIFPIENKPVNRILAEFSKFQKDIIIEKMILRVGREYSEQYKELTKDFFLAF